MNTEFVKTSDAMVSGNIAGNQNFSPRKNKSFLFIPQRVVLRWGYTQEMARRPSDEPSYMLGSCAQSKGCDGDNAT